MSNLYNLFDKVTEQYGEINKLSNSILVTNTRKIMKNHTYASRSYLKDH